MALQLPPFRTFLRTLNEAGVETRSARGFWGGITPHGDIVATAWIDRRGGHNGFVISRPRTRHGGLRDAWDLGRITDGALIRLIILRQRGDAPPGERRQMKDAALMPGQWRVMGEPFLEGDRTRALVEPVE
jgi:hypothetical protein